MSLGIHEGSLSARLDRLPLSRPHWLLLLIGGLGYTFDGMDSAVVAFLMPDVKEVFSLSNGQLGLVASAAPFGFLFGAFFAGYLGDRLGRRKVMMYALAVYAIASLLAAASWNFEVFLGARIIAGAGAGAESAIIAPFLAEFVPSHRRGWFIGALAGFFSFGFVAAALIGRFVVPVFPEGWRWAQVITFLPILMLLWWRRNLPESPRYLLNAGRTDEAEAVVADLEGQVRLATSAELPPVDPNHADEPAPQKFSLGRALRFLWGPKMWRITSVTWLIWFSITFAYYGFFSWIPTLLVDKGLTVTTSFTYSLFIYLAQIPGYFSAAWVNEKLDRKYTIAIYLGGSAVSALWLSQMTEPALIMVAGIALSFFLNGTYAGVYAYTPEVFPTWLRATGVGLSSAFGRIGSITAPLIIGVFAVQWGFAGVFGMTTAVLAFGITCTLLFAVRTRNRSLEDITMKEVLGRPHRRSSEAPMPDSPGLGSLAEIHRAVQAETGAKLFTVLAFTDGGRTMHRIYSSNPHEYPVGGKKDVTRDVAADWITRCVSDQAPYFGRTRDDVRRIFADSALIESLGCGSIINVPVVRDGLTIAALNILDAEGAYSGSDVEKALVIANRAVDVIDETIKELQ